MMNQGSSAKRSHVTLKRHLDPNVLPKRILALDGGGVRGILTLQYLERIETILRDRHRKPNLVLSDYFDLIGGTSTGAIIAGALALGFPVSKIQQLYRDLASRIFKKPFFRFGAIVPKFGNRALQRALQNAYGSETTMGSGSLRTGLLIVTKRMDTGSPWPLTNHPRDPYFQPQPGKHRIGTANMLLWQIVRASTAAPHYFRPENVVVGSALDPPTGSPIFEEGQFIDGGVSTANNPAFQLLKVALLQGFSFRWSTGKDRLLMVSVGTGIRSRRLGRARGLRATAGVFAASALLSLMDDCNDEVEIVMQWLSNSPTARQIDGQIRDLHGDLLLGKPILSYSRYNVLLESDWLSRELNIKRAQEALNELGAMDQPRNMDELEKLGAEAAAAQIRPHHFPRPFDCT